MSKLPNSVVSFPTPTPQISQSLSPEELAAHRSRIGFEVEVVLSGYWQTDMDPKLRAGVLADWADELEDWTISQIRWGLREWRRDNPRRKPNPGHILAVLKERRGRAAAAQIAADKQSAEPARAEIDDDTRALRQAAIQEIISGFRKKSSTIAH